MIYAVNYDLKEPDRDYKGLYSAIKGCGDWLHCLDSTWLVDTENTDLDAKGIWKRLEPHVDDNDRVLVIGVTRDYAGQLPKKAREWIKARRAKMAAQRRER